ncbi:MAG: endonuclease/exonuclease/phosphatase family protein [Planctomycetota bacterium]
MNDKDLPSFPAATPAAPPPRAGFFSLRVRLGGLFAALVAIAVAGTVSAYVARLAWFFDAATSFRIQYFAVLGAGALGCLALRKWRAAAFCGAFAFLNLCYILPIYAALRPEHQATSWVSFIKARRVLLLNVCSQNRDFEATRALIRTEKPDFIVLEEVTDGWMRQMAGAKWERGERSGLAADYPHLKAVPRPDSFGIAIFSRMPFEKAIAFSSGEADVPFLAARIPLDGTLLTLVAAHPLPPRRADYWHWRNQQLSSLAQYAAAQPRPLLLAGDLNMTSWSPSFGFLLRESRLRDSRQGFGIQASWPANLWPIRVPLDHVLVSDGIEIRDRRLGPNVGSDHLPVIADFALQR